MQGKFWNALEKGKGDVCRLLADTVYSSVLQSFIGKGNVESEEKPLES